MKILFMCVANSARSQLAESLAKTLLPDAEIHSAGSHPTQLNSFAVKVMAEIGVDISLHYSKSFESLPLEFVDKLDFVITLCEEEACPVLRSNAKKLHWPFPDPASNEPLSDSELLNRFRKARDRISIKISEFKRELNNLTPKKF